MNRQRSASRSAIICGGPKEISASRPGMVLRRMCSGSMAGNGSVSKSVMFRLNLFSVESYVTAKLQKISGLIGKMGYTFAVSM